MTLDSKLAALPPTALGILFSYLEKDPIFKSQNHPHIPHTFEKVSLACPIQLHGQATMAEYEKNGELKTKFRHEYSWIDPHTLGTLERTAISFNYFKVLSEVVLLNQKTLKQTVTFKFSDPHLNRYANFLFINCVERNLKYLQRYDLKFFEKDKPQGNIFDYTTWGQIVPRKLTHTYAFSLSVQLVFRSQEIRSYFSCKILDSSSFTSETTLERFIAWKVITDSVERFSEDLNIKIN